MRAKYISVVMLSLLQSACASVSHSPYPPEWPQQIGEHGGCQHISGRFHNEAEGRAYDHPKSQWLLGLTLFPHDERLRRVRSIRLLFEPSGSLRVSGYNDVDTILIERVYAPGNEFVRCRDGQLHIDPERVQAPDNPVVGFGSSELTLGIAEDGSLILHEVASATGLAFLIIPVHSESDQWYLFAPYQTEP